MTDDISMESYLWIFENSSFQTKYSFMLYKSMAEWQSFNILQQEWRECKWVLLSEHSIQYFTSCHFNVLALKQVTRLTNCSKTVWSTPHLTRLSFILIWSGIWDYDSNSIQTHNHAPDSNWPMSKVWIIQLSSEC